MSELLERVRAFREEGNTKGMTDAVPYAKFLGITIDTSGGEVVGKMTFGEHLIGNPSIPALHGGTVGALLESTAIFHLMWEAETIVIPKTINITVDYLRSGRPQDTFARASSPSTAIASSTCVRKRGRTIRRAPSPMRTRTS